MPWTLGALNTDDVQFSMNLAAGGSNHQFLVTGWWLPTTLTAGRGLWSIGNHGAVIDSTTDELRMYIDRVTTDSQDTTTGVDLVVGQWKFVAFMFSGTDSGSAQRWRVWAGNIENAPVEVTITNAVAPSGGLFSGTAICFGTRGTTSTNAWQGDFDEGYVVTSNAAVGATNPFSLATVGDISDAEAENIFRRYVSAAWSGTFFERPRTESAYLSARAGAVAQRSGIVDAPPFIAVTVNGATLSANGPPRPRWDTQPMRAMARR